MLNFILRYQPIAAFMGAGGAAETFNLLQENNDALLLETNDNILLESAP